MSEQLEQRDPQSLFVLNVVGNVAPRGETIGLHIERKEQEPINLCIRAEDVKHLIGLLLNLGHEAKRRQVPSRNTALPKEAIPLPIDAINVGQGHDDETFLLLEAGLTPLMVVLPPKCLEQIGQTMLIFSAKSPAQS